MPLSEWIIYPPRYSVLSGALVFIGHSVKGVLLIFRGCPELLPYANRARVSKAQRVQFAYPPEDRRACFSGAGRRYLGIANTWVYIPLTRMKFAIRRADTTNYAIYRKRYAHAMKSADGR